MARSVWTGSIGFGLVNVPVKAYPAVRDHDVHFHQIDRRSGSRIHNRKVAGEGGREIDPGDIRLGFEVTKGHYVTFDKDELDELRPESTRVIEVSDFVPLDEIDPIYYDRTYWLAPDGDPAIKPYQLLRAAMEERGLVAIGTVVMRNKQYLTAIRPLEGALAMSTMRFADEVVPRADVDEVPDRRAKPDAKMLRMATSLVDSLTSDWKPDRYHDTYTEELRDRIEAKGKGEELTTEPQAEQGPEVVDLMEALEKSIGRAGGRGRRGGKARRSRKSA